MCVCVSAQDRAHIGKKWRSSSCHAVLIDCGEGSLGLYIRVCVCRVVLAGVCEAGSWSAICHRILSRCPDTDRSSAGLWGQQRGPPLQDSRSFLSTNSAPRCSAERHASDRPTFLCDCRSVSLKLGGQLSKMITLCIKYAAVSNFSFFSSVSFNPLSPSCFFLTDPMGEEHHAWRTSWIFTLMVVVCIHWSVLFYFSWLHTLLFFPAVHMYTVKVPLME